MSPHPPESKLPIRRGWRIAGGLVLVLALGLVFWGTPRPTCRSIGKTWPLSAVLTRPDANKPRRSRYPTAWPSFAAAPCSRRVPMQDAPLSYPELSLPDIGGLPAAGTLVLTVNNRLARRLTLELAGLLRAERQVSELPRIVPLSAWLAESANELAFDAGGDMPAYRLDSFATQMVWTEAIRAGRPSACCWTRARRRGWPWTPTCSWTSGSCACHRARTPMNTRALPAGACATARPWPSWTPRMRTRVMRACWTRWASRLATPQRLVLAGFTEVSPRFARLLDAFAAQGSDIGQWRDAQRAPRSRASLRGPGSGQRVARRRELGRDAIAGPSDRSLRHRLAATGSRIRVRPARAGPGAGRPRRRARAGVQRGRGPATG